MPENENTPSFELAVLTLLRSISEKLDKLRITEEEIIKAVHVVKKEADTFREERKNERIQLNEFKMKYIQHKQSKGYPLEDWEIENLENWKKWQEFYNELSLEDQVIADKLHLVKEFNIL